MLTGKNMFDFFDPDHVFYKPTKVEKHRSDIFKIFLFNLTPLVNLPHNQRKPPNP